ncbi:MAG: hypothetical protein ACTSXQ_06575 [Alphaproteobacteria bacterium]
MMAEANTKKKSLRKKIAGKMPLKKDAAKASAPTPPSKKKSAFIGKETHRRFIIDTKKALPEFDALHAKAYGLENVSTGNTTEKYENYFVLIADPDYFPRIQMIKEQVRAESKGFMAPTDWGIIQWAETSKEMIAIIFEKHSGEKLFNDITDEITPIPIETIKKWLETLLPEIRTFQDFNLTHRSIRPTNIFHHNESFIIGEAVSAYPGAGQSGVFEPIESAMCFPNAGRGQGDIADDFYALGITILFMFLGRSPIDVEKEKKKKGLEKATQKKESDFLFERLNYGSYRTLTKDLTLDPAMVILLRGLLQDDAEHRWNVSDIEGWCFGRHTNTNRVFSSSAGEQTINFGGRKHLKIRSLVSAFCERPQEAIPKLYSGELYTNMERIINAENVSFTMEHINSLVKSSGSPQSGGVDVALARVSMLADPKAPIRYKGLTFFPEGLAYILPQLKKEKKTSVIKDIEKYNLLVYWTNINSSKKNVEVTKAVEKYINDERFASGIEKCTYLFNTDTSCQSLLFKGLFIDNFPRILTVLEEVVKKDKEVNILDSDLAAFLMVRDSIPERWEDKVDSKDPNSRNFLNMLRLLSKIQEEMEQNIAMPHVAMWFCARLKKYIETFKSNTRKEKALKKTEKIAEKGSLKLILDLVLNPEELEKEEEELRIAKHKYNLIEKDIDSYRTFRSYIFSPSYTFGWTLANIISIVALLITLIYFT